MTRDEAVTRIQNGLGFTSSASTYIISRLQEAQRELEKGKTLPKFLLQEDQTLTLVDGTSTVALPTGFIRKSENDPIRYLPTGEETPYYLVERQFASALTAYAQTDASGPKVYAIRKATIEFFPTADRTYSLTWSYYKHDAVLSTNIENEWLKAENAPEWLIGEAGYRIAFDRRDKDAMALFGDMAKKARAALLAEIIAADDSGGPYFLGGRP